MKGCVKFKTPCLDLSLDPVHLSPHLRGCLRDDRSQVSIFSSNSSYLLPPGCHHYVFSPVPLTCAKSFLSLSHEITFPLGFPTPLVSPNAGNYELPFTFIPHLLIAHLGSGDNHRCQVEEFGHCPDSSGYCRFLTM